MYFEAPSIFLIPLNCFNFLPLNDFTLLQNTAMSLEASNYFFSECFPIFSYCFLISFSCFLPYGISQLFICTGVSVYHLSIVCFYYPALLLLL